MAGRYLLSVSSTDQDQGRLSPKAPFFPTAGRTPRGGHSHLTRLAGPRGRRDSRYLTLTTEATGFIMYFPSPVCLMDRSPSKSRVMVVCAVVRSNSRLSLRSPEGTSTGALRPAGAAIVAAHGVPLEALSK